MGSSVLFSEELEKDHQQLLESWTLQGLHQPAEHCPSAEPSGASVIMSAPVTMSAPVVRHSSPAGPGAARTSVERVESPPLVNNRVDSQKVQLTDAEENLQVNRIQPWKSLGRCRYALPPCK